MSENWLALMIGNSRLHWALFQNETIIHTWDSSYLPKEIKLENPKELIKNIPLSPTPPLPPSPPLFLASVVPSQTELWQNYPDVRIIALEQIPIKNTYPTLGIDRALALYGAGTAWGFPMLVIDAGTALTFTGADNHKNFIGGAILPGLGLQLATLNQKTGQLPLVQTQIIASLPPRFALNTEEAIKSGVIYTLLAGIKDFIEAWLRDFTESKIAITGGDAKLLFSYLKIHFPQMSTRLTIEQNLIFWGIRKLVMSNE